MGTSPHVHTSLTTGTTAPSTIKMKSIIFETLAFAMVIFAASTHAMARRQATSDPPSMAPVTVAMDANMTADAGSDAGNTTTDGGDVNMPDTTTTTDTPPPTTTTTQAPPTTTTIPVVVCDNNNEYYDLVRDFANTTYFIDLSENEKIFVYEMLAASEGCNMIPSSNL